MTEHEDIELGRCVLHHTGVGCTKSYEMGTLFKNNYNVEETDSEGLKPVFEEVAGHSGMVFTSFIQSSSKYQHFRSSKDRPFSILTLKSHPTQVERNRF